MTLWEKLTMSETTTLPSTAYNRLRAALRNLINHHVINEVAKPASTTLAIKETILRNRLLALLNTTAYLSGESILHLTSPDGEITEVETSLNVEYIRYYSDLGLQAPMGLDSACGLLLARCMVDAGLTDKELINIINYITNVRMCILEQYGNKSNSLLADYDLTGVAGSSSRTVMVSVINTLKANPWYLLIILLEDIC